MNANTLTSNSINKITLAATLDNAYATDERLTLESTTSDGQKYVVT